MALYLIQHGKCLSKQEDPDQPLSSAGIANVQRIADVAEHYGIQVQRIEHSVKTRARQTAQILADALQPEQGMHERTGLKAMDDIRRVADRVKTADHLMLVGHLPFMQKLTSYLVIGKPDQRIFRFQNGGIVCLDQDDMGWYLKWTLMPNIR